MGVDYEGGFVSGSLSLHHACRSESPASERLPFLPPAASVPPSWTLTASTGSPNKPALL